MTLPFAATLAAALLGAADAPAPARTPAPHVLPPSSSVVDGSRLPGQAPPDSLDRMLQLPRPHAPTPPDLTPAPSMEAAIEGARAALAACAAKGYRIGVAVTDADGHLLVGLTATGAQPGRIFTAVQKGLAAIAWRRPTSQAQAMLRRDRSSAASLLHPNMVVVPGAVPLFTGDRLVGTIGASGATGDEDEACASVGAARIAAQLR